MSSKPTTVADDWLAEVCEAMDEAHERFHRMTFDEKTERLKAAGILGPDGKLTPRYRGRWNGYEEELEAPPSSPAK